MINALVQWGLSVLILNLPTAIAASDLDQVPLVDSIAGYNKYEEYEGIDDSQLQYMDIASKFKRDVIEVSQYSHIDDWDVQNLMLYRGGYKAYNFTTNSTGSSYSTIAYLSANICKYPDSIGDESALQYLNFYQSYDGGQTFYPLDFDEGYYQSVDSSKTSTGDLTVLLYVEFVNNTDVLDTDYFSLQFAVSADDLVFQWDNGTFASLVDADDDSAFFQSTLFNLTGSSREDVENGTSGYNIHIFKDEENSYFNGLSRSWCALRDATPLISNSNITTFYSDSNSDFRKQFFVDGLNASTNYIAYVTRDFQDADNTTEGGVVFSKVQFSTQKEGVCELIYGLNFCTDVTYSVPQSTAFFSDNNKTALMELYDSYAASVYANFSKAMQQVNCLGEDDTRYSPIVPCSDCSSSYKSWLCAVTIPRCSTSERDEYLLREVGNSRSDYLNEVVNPPNDYYEVLPCINLCYGIVRDCPSSFGFACPETNDTLLQSYYFVTNDNYTTCNLIGNTTTITVSSDSLTLKVNFAWMVWGLILVSILVV